MNIYENYFATGDRRRISALCLAKRIGSYTSPANLLQAVQWFLDQSTKNETENPALSLACLHEALKILNRNRFDEDLNQQNDLLVKCYETRHRIHKKRELTNLEAWDAWKILNLKKNIEGSDMTNFVAASFSTYDFASAMKLIEDNMDIAIMAALKPTIENYMTKDNSMGYLGYFVHDLTTGLRSVFEDQDYFDKLNKEILDKQYNIEIADFDGRGRGIRALKDFEAGEIVLKEFPMCCATFNPKCCFHCMKYFENEPPVKCPGPGCNTRYCSDQCQVSASNTYHRVLCGNSEVNAVRDLIKATESPSSLCTPVMLKLVASSIQQNIDVDDLEGIYNLHGFIAKDTQVGPFRYAYHQIEQVIRAKLENANEKIEWDWYMNVCSKVLLNMFGYDPNPAQNSPIDQWIGALYNVTSYFNHNCNNNCAKDFDGATVIFKTKRKVNKGEELTIQYFPPADAVQAVIHFGFACSCSNCQNIYATMKDSLPEWVFKNK